MVADFNSPSIGETLLTIYVGAYILGSGIDPYLWYYGAPHELLLTASQERDHC